MSSSIRFLICIIFTLISHQDAAPDLTQHPADMYFVNIPVPGFACKRTCFGQTAPGNLTARTPSGGDTQPWFVLSYPHDPAHKMFLANVDISDCEFVAPPVVSVSLAARFPNESYVIASVNDPPTAKRFLVTLYSFVSSPANTAPPQDRLIEHFRVNWVAAGYSNC
ncbi:hypothetical protein ACHWQZ_G018383 [Mnemiopsis leidyi]